MIAAGEKQSARSVAVLDLLGRVSRLTVSAGEDVPALAEVRTKGPEA